MAEIIVLDLMIILVFLVLARLPSNREALEYEREASWQEIVKTLELGE